MSRIIIGIAQDLHDKLKELASELAEKGEDDPMDRAVEIVVRAGFEKLYEYNRFFELIE